MFFNRFYFYLYLDYYFFFHSSFYFLLIDFWFESILECEIRQLEIKHFKQKMNSHCEVRIWNTGEIHYQFIHNSNSDVFYILNLFHKINVFLGIPLSKLLHEKHNHKRKICSKMEIIGNSEQFKKKDRQSFQWIHQLFCVPIQTHTQK